MLANDASALKQGEAHPLRESLRAHGVEEISEAALRIIDLSGLEREGVSGPISTSRLFLGAVDAAAETSGGESGEAAALGAFGAAVRVHSEKLAAFRQRYVSEQKSGVRTAPGFTENAAEILRRAQSNALARQGEGTLRADALIAAILALERGRLSERLRALGLPMEVLARETLAGIAQMQPALLSDWEEAVQLRMQADEAPAQPQHSSAAPTPTPPRAAPPAENYVPVAWLGNDNPWQSDLNDCLGAGDEAAAFAALSLSSQFTPPLAVGVFGDWGSGKSFFMKLVHQHIVNFTAKGAAEGGAGALLRHVVQIRFNAWHYVDTNLWASLVDHIFGELDKALRAKNSSEADKVFDQLATARELTLASAQRLVARRRDQQMAARKAARAQRELAQARQSVPSSPRVVWQAVGRSLVEQLKGNKELLAAARTLGLTDVMREGEALRSAVKDLQSERGKANLLAAGLQHQRFSLPTVALGTLLLLAGWLLVARYLPLFDAAFLQQLAGFAAGALAAVTGVVTTARARVQKAVSVVSAMGGQLQRAVDEALKQPQAEYDLAQDALADRSAEVAESEALLAVTTERLSEAAREYNAGTGHGRLLKFIRERATSETYSRHLGLVATVRRDFEELASRMDSAAHTDPVLKAEQERQDAAYKVRVDELIRDADGLGALLKKEEKEKLRASGNPQPLSGEERVERIVLYIDDLDRCQPEKVAEVLQAVHLLLSFQLFIVFVAVDVRWVTRALQKHYPMLIDPRSVGLAHGNAATAHDYLEKIFQVPYWVRPMTDTASEEFLGERLKRIQPPARAAAPAQAPAPAAADTTDSLASGGSAPAQPPGSLSAGSSPPAPGAAAITAPSGGAAPKPAVETVARNLELSGDERRFMQVLSKCAGASPRRALRFLNVYQIVKASIVGAREVQALEQGGFYPMMVQVAIVTGAPALLERWQAWIDEAVPTESLAQVRARLAKEEWLQRSDQRRNLEGALAVLQDQRPSAMAGDLKAYGSLAKRYSFTG